MPKRAPRLTGLNGSGQPSWQYYDMGEPLTLREKGVLAMLARGSSISAIADALDLAERTVRVHIEAATRKLGVADSTQAVALALCEGLITSAGTES